ncbi:MAG: hypothetical protein OXG96_07730, partial [Acidobacteria bacterium]|nr:hypothetical protein [Acidobacteriota bacterium]
PAMPFSPFEPGLIIAQGQGRNLEGSVQHPWGKNHPQRDMKRAKSHQGHEIGFPESSMRRFFINIDAQDMQDFCPQPPCPEIRPEANPPPPHDFFGQ